MLDQIVYFVWYDLDPQWPHKTNDVAPVLYWLTLSQTTNFRLFQTQKNAGNNFRFDENCRKFSKQEENTVGKGEIAHYEKFLVFPQCFQKTCTVNT